MSLMILYAQIIFRYVLTLTVIYPQYIMKLWLIVKEMFTNDNLLMILIYVIMN